jgi:hypothetical protein
LVALNAMGPEFFGVNKSFLCHPEHIASLMRLEAS